MMKQLKAMCLFTLIIITCILVTQSMAEERIGINKLNDPIALETTQKKQDSEKQVKKEEVKRQIQLEAMQVTATRTERAIDLTPRSVTLIDKEKIESRNAASALELLDEVPGISFSRAGPLGGQLSIRGFNSNDAKSPLFIDGDRFRGRNTLEYLLLDPTRIERIEIIRGPAAAMYGTDAMGGLINVITRKAEGDVSGPFELIPRLRALNYSSVSNLRGGRLELQGLGNGFDMLLGLAGKKADDYESPEGDIKNSDMETWSADLRLGYTPTQGHRIELSAKYADVEQGQAGGIYGAPGYPYTVRRQEPMKEKMLKLHYEGRNNALGLEHIGASLYARHLYTHMIIEKRPAADPSSGLTRTDSYVDGPLITGGKLFGVRPWGHGHTLTLGVDFLYEDRSGSEKEVTKYDAAGNQTSHSPRTKGGPDSAQTNMGLFAHNDWDPSEQWTVSVGGRVDYFRTTTETDLLPDYEGSTETTDYPVTGSLGIIYRPIPIIHLTANASTTYRAPATYEKFGISPGFDPNPDLKPEKGVTYEVGARLRLPRVTANLTAFHSDYEDLIVRTTIDSTVYPGTRATQRQNVGEACMKGLELDAAWFVNSHWKTFMNAAYLHGTDTNTDTPLAYIAPLNGLVGVRYTPDSKDFYIEATDKWSTKKDHIDENKERETDAYNILNLYAGFDIRKLSSSLPDMELRLAVENILDKAYSNPTTTEDITFDRSITNPLLEPGRCISISLTSRF
jgi:hemoglobin/transferrin/lactoferrin receptor protein